MDKDQNSIAESIGCTTLVIIVVAVILKFIQPVAEPILRSVFK